MASINLLALCYGMMNTVHNNTLRSTVVNSDYYIVPHEAETATLEFTLCATET